MRTIVTDSKFLITRPSLADMQEFLDAVQSSQQHLQEWVYPPDSKEKYLAYLKRAESKSTESFFIKLKNPTNEIKKQYTLIGVININEIVYKSFQSGYLGFYRLCKEQRAGIMSSALMHVINYAFYNLGLHRLEANIQPNNNPSLNFIKKAGFCEEGFSKNYLKIGGLWQDHIRFAISKERLENLYIANANASPSPWQADFNVKTIHLQNLCETISKTQFESFKKIAEGWDNWVYLADAKIIFRIPRRYIGIALFSRENKVLNFLKNKLNLNIPDPKFSGLGDSLFPYPIQGYTQIPGKSCIEKPIKLTDRINSVISFARFLKKIHNIPLSELYAAEIGPTVFNRCNFPVIKLNYKQRLNKLHTNGLLEGLDLENLPEIYNKAQLASTKLSEKCLIHGDLYSRHLIFNENILSGIIDWGDTGINNPAVDLAALYSFFPPDCHAVFFENYGYISQECKDYARFLGIYTTLNFLDYAIDTKNLAIESETKMSLRMQINKTYS